jgi:hypothetical protein
MMMVKIAIEKQEKRGKSVNKHRHTTYIYYIYPLRVKTRIKKKRISFTFLQEEN